MNDEERLALATKGVAAWNFHAVNEYWILGFHDRIPAIVQLRAEVAMQTWKNREFDITPPRADSLRLPFWLVGTHTN